MALKQETLPACFARGFSDTQPDEDASPPADTAREASPIPGPRVIKRLLKRSLSTMSGVTDLDEDEPPPGRWSAPPTPPTSQSSCPATPLHGTARGSATPHSTVKETNAQRKNVLKRWYRKKQYLKDEPALVQHWEDLQKKYNSHHPALFEFKQKVGECSRGKFDDPYFTQLKKRIKIDSWGKDKQLGSWKQLCDKHGKEVAYRALKQVMIPHVPNTMLMPGHGVQWPENRQFVMEERFWMPHWRDTITWETDDYEFPADLEAQISKFIAESNDDTPKAWDEFAATAETAIPTWMHFPQPAAAAVVQISDDERAIHPDYSGTKYDELHALTFKNLNKLVSEWAKAKQKVDVNINKIKNVEMCKGPAVVHIDSVVGKCEKLYTGLVDSHTTMMVKAKGVLSIHELNEIKHNIDDLWVHYKDVCDFIKPLLLLASLPS